MHVIFQDSCGTGIKYRILKLKCLKLLRTSTEQTLLISLRFLHLIQSNLHLKRLPTLSRSSTISPSALIIIISVGNSVKFRSVEVVSCYHWLKKPDYTSICCYLLFRSYAGFITLFSESLSLCVVEKFKQEMVNRPRSNFSDM